ncbi:MAG TPA: alginate lyase family protein [Gemmatimonadales bacterium]|nr:alginate lyase family protein [Gemmatimonadales bacterium]
MRATWSKLKGRSLAELRLRARQQVAAWSELVGISSQVRLPDDRRLTAPSLERFRTRTRPRFFAAFDQPDAVVATLRRRWPESEPQTLDAAERICQGQFDLLGRSGLRFGVPVDWHWDPMSGTRLERVHWSRVDPPSVDMAADVKLIWELNRHQYFVTLGKAYWYTGDERYAATFVEHLMAWMDANPPKRGINWASSLELAFRAISWIWGLYFFKASPSLTETTYRRTLKFLFLHARHIETYLSIYGPNTHLTGEALGLLYLGTMFPEFRDAERWRRVGSSILVEQLDDQIRPDGSYFEQSTYYHRYTADFYLHASILGGLNGLPIDAAVRGKLQALLAHLMYLTQPDGRTPLLGDDDGGRLLFLDQRAPDDFRAPLATGAVLSRRPDFRYVAGEAAEEVLWLLGTPGLHAFDVLKPVPPAATTQAFADGGYYMMRDGWGRDANTLLVDCGPHGALRNCAHAHADALSVTLVVRGTPVLVDPGTYTYRSLRGLRDYFRASATHNTVTVAGESSSVPGGPFNWRRVGRSALTEWRPGARCDYFEAVDDGYRRLTPPALHRRSVFFLRGDYWIIRDRVVTEGDHVVALHFHFAPGITLQILSGSRARATWTSTSDPETLDIGVFGHAAVMRASEGLVSSSYGMLSRAETSVCTAHGRGPRDLVSFLVPSRGGDEPIALEERPATNARAFVLADQAVEDTVLVGGDGDADGGDLASDAAWVWVRRPRRADTPTEFVMLQGRRLKWRGRLLVKADAPVSYIAARLQGSEVHVDVDAAGRCDIALPGAERLVVSGAPTATVGMLGAGPPGPPALVRALEVG